MKKIFLILLYLITPSLFGELLSGATSPFFYFNPMTIIIFSIIYGLPLLLIREIIVKWELKHSAFFLIMLIGIIIEGIIMQSFFNISHTNLDTLSGYGVVLGVQIPWMILTITSHGLISGALPIVILENIWPEYKKQSLLNSKTFAILLLVALIGIFVVSIIIIGTLDEFKDYIINPLHLLGTILICMGLLKLAHKNNVSKFRSTVPTARTCLIQSFLITFLTTLGPFIFASLNVPSFITIILQVISLILIYRWVKYNVYHPAFTSKHMTSTVLGILSLWLLMTPIHEFFNNDPGMIIVGIIFTVLFFIWKKRIPSEEGT